MPRARAYGIGEQFGWDVLPPELSADVLALAGASENASPAAPHPQASPAAAGGAVFDASVYGAVTPPWSAERAIANLYGPKAAARSVPATVVGNVRVTDVGKDYDTHHIVLDFGSVTYPVLEGQSIGIIPPGTDADGRPHFPREYSVASPRNGERPGLQQCLAHRETGARGSSGSPRSRRRKQLSLRLESGRRRRGDRTVRRELPHAQPPEERDRDDLHRHRKRADAGDDRVAALLAQIRQVRRRQVDAVLRRPHERGTAVFRPAFEPAQGLHRHQLRLQPDARRAEALRTGRDAGPGGRSRSPDRRPGRLFLRLRLESDGGRRGQGAARHRDRVRARLGDAWAGAQTRRPAASGNLLTGP